MSATLTDEGVGGVRLASGQLEVWTDDDGRFTFQSDGPGYLLAVRAEHPSFVPRETHLSWARMRQDVALDLIRDAPPFSLAFYRQLVRNGHDEPEDLEPLRRWLTAPAWYLETETRDTGEEVPPADLDQVEAALRAVVPAWTGGAFAATVVERGTTPPREAGWIIVRFRREPSSDYYSGEYCGLAQVAANPGWIEIVAHPTSVNCCNDPSHTTAHEVGHALGFWHVAGRREEYLMSNSEGRSCQTTAPNDAEQYHARIAYTRRPGNTDPDDDPDWVFLAQPGDLPPIVVR